MVPVRLSRYLALAWLALVVYASLHPFTGWRDLGLSPLAFFEARWPRWWTGFDLGLNVLAYVPLGYFLTLGLVRPRHRGWAALLATLLATGLSLSLEIIQGWLPTRVPSSLDLACNGLGAALGAALAWRSGHAALAALNTLQQRRLAPVPHADAGLVLLGLWLLTQLTPETLLFGAGDLRSLLGLLGLTSGMSYAAPRFFLIEALVTGSNTVAIGLLCRHLLRTNKRQSLQPALLVLGFLLLALLIRTLAAAVLISPREALAWLTPGASLGLLGGGVLLAATLALPAGTRLILAGLTLMAGAVLVNLAPENPYSAAAMAVWRQGHFFNFNGATRLTASLWPFFALGWLLLALTRRSYTAPPGYPLRPPHVPLASPGSGRHDRQRRVLHAPGQAPRRE